VGAKNMVRTKSMAPDHTANDIIANKTKILKNLFNKRYRRVNSETGS
jgi:hypothetical protein